MSLSKTLSFVCLASATALGHGLAPSQQSVEHGLVSNQPNTVMWCADPIKFYSDCSFKNQTSSISVQSGFTLDNVDGEPKAFVVPAGCRVTLFTKAYASYSSQNPSHAVLIKMMMCCLALL